MGNFKLVSGFQPAGDQGEAILKLTEGIREGKSFQTLKGVTGSGKTFTMAKVIEAVDVPTLVISHNKTLAAQLYREFKDFFPENAVEYFVSYYDYYQPEAYVAGKDLYIEKDASINEEIDRLRLSATTSLMERRDVIVVATVSCIYGIGNPKDFMDMRLEVEKGRYLDVRKFINRLVLLQYDRNDAVLERSRFRVRGDVVEVFPSYSKNYLRLEFYGDEVERITRIEPVTGKVLEDLDLCTVYPARFFVTPQERIRNAVEKIKEELEVTYKKFLNENKLLEAERIKTRTEYDIEMLEEMGFCTGIENYSRHLSGRKEGERPAVLIDFFPKDFLTFIDESHVTIPQLRGMYEGDRSRKQSLVKYGFRLPSALDNRPLHYAEFKEMLDGVIFVSATPGKDEEALSKTTVEQIIRPTGLLDPELEVRPTEGQVDDIIREIKIRNANGERTLITTLTKKMAEDLTEYLSEVGLRVRYLHSEIETIERVEILKGLRQGEFDILIGINLLREGLDLPEVSLIVILDADKIGFLRSSTSLIQTIGRAARNVHGKVIMYADRMSDAMRGAISETNRRRKIQEEYNVEHGITPQSIVKSIQDILVRKKDKKRGSEKLTLDVIEKGYNLLAAKERKALVKRLKKEMLELAKNLEFEEAAVVRDEISRIEKLG